MALNIYGLRWSVRRDSNPRPSAPKTGQTIHWSPLQFVENKRSRLNYLARIGSILLISVALGCFARYKIATHKITLLAVPERACSIFHTARQTPFGLHLQLLPSWHTLAKDTLRKSRLDRRCATFSWPVSPKSCTLRPSASRPRRSEGMSS
jgi:hypothetical protein